MYTKAFMRRDTRRSTQGGLIKKGGNGVKVVGVNVEGLWPSPLPHHH